MKMFQTGFQHSAEGKLAPNVVPSPANGLCTAALLWPPEQARALSTEMLLPRRGRMKPLCDQREGRNAWLLAEGGTALLVGLCEYSVCWEQSRERQNVPLLAQCSYGGQTHGRARQSRLSFSCVPSPSLANFCTQPWPFQPHKQTELALLLCSKDVMRQRQAKPFFSFRPTK